VQPVAVLTIAGSDSGGGAGIEADLRTFAALGVHGLAAITAITAQNTYEVRAVCALEAEMVRAQVETVTDDITAAAVKTGMLARAHTVAVVAALAREGRFTHLIVDPVLVSSSGHALMEPSGVRAYREELLPLATIATPNLREAAVLAEVDISELRTVQDMVSVARNLLALGPRAVVVKGGHFGSGTDREARAPDVFVMGDRVEILDAARIETRNDHGTGCTFAAACAARMALGDDEVAAVLFAKEFVQRALLGAARWNIGRGHGPIDHMGWQ
jgi:hydroxymethylpyrimidine/phosphomethylpyrimidine kinase